MAGVAEDDSITHLRARVGATLLDKWRLDALLGVGGMAAVYAATHRNGKRCAIKILHAEISRRSDLRARFLREGYIANKVQNPGVVSVLDDDISEDGSVFLVMELLDGESLETRRQRKGGKLPLDEVLSLVDQVLSTLIAAHQKQVVHRDLKPDNIFLTRTGQVKVLDFGIARVREETHLAASTRPGATMGTPGFMAPEQARGRSELIDSRTDLWALGAMMFLLITGKHVHKAETINEEMILTATTPARSIRVVNPQLPEPFVELVDRSLAFEQEGRWADASTMQQALRTAYHTTLGSPLDDDITHSSLAKLDLPEPPPSLGDELSAAESQAAPPLVDVGFHRTGTLSSGVSALADIPGNPASIMLRRPGLLAALIGSLTAMTAGIGIWLSASKPTTPSHAMHPSGMSLPLSPAEAASSPGVAQPSAPPPAHNSAVDAPTEQPTTMSHPNLAPPPPSAEENDTPPKSPSSPNKDLGSKEPPVVSESPRHPLHALILGAPTAKKRYSAGVVVAPLKPLGPAYPAAEDPVPMGLSKSRK